MIESSIIIKSLYTIYCVFVEAFRSSIVIKAIGRPYSTLRNWSGESAILGGIRRTGRINGFFEESTVYKAGIGLVQLPTSLFVRLYRKKALVFKESMTFRVLGYLADRLHLLIGGFLFIMVVTPYASWNNLYALAGDVLLLLLFLVKTVIREDSRFSPSAFSFYSFVFAVAVVLAFVTSIAPMLSLRFFIFYVDAFLLVLLLVSEIDSLEKFEGAFKVFLMGVTVTGLYGIFQWIIGIPVSASQMDVTIESNLVGRVYSTIGNPNNYAEVLVLTLPFYAAFFLNAKKMLAKAFYAAMALPVLVSFLLTYSRSSWLGLAFAVFIFILFKNWKLIPLFAVLGLAAFPLLPASIHGRIMTIFTGDSSTSMRFVIWQQVWPVIKDFWVTGIGLGPDVFIKIMNRYPVVKESVHSHNIFIQILIETGVFGLLSFLGMQLHLLKDGIKATKTHRNPELNNYIHAAIAAVFGFLLIGLVEYVWHEHRVMLFYFMVVGFLMALLRNAREA